MPDIAAYKVDAFTERAYGGNPAGVVPDAADLSEREMRAIAREMNLSETAFVLRPTVPGAGFRLRFFTPSAEVPLCGHATIATFHLLHEVGRVKAGTFQVQTEVGILPVEIRPDGRVFLTSDPLTYAPSPLSRAELAAVLGLDAGEVLDGAMLVKEKLIVPVKGLKTLETMRPDFGAIRRASADRGFQGIAPLSMETRDPDAATHIRYFAPHIGIDEDPVTGTAHMALAGYLLKTGRMHAKCVFLGEQGDFCGRPGCVEVEIGGSAEAPHIAIGGRAVTVLRGTMAVPPAAPP